MIRWNIYRALLRAARRTRMVLDADFARAVRLSPCRRAGFLLSLLAFLATSAKAAACPSVEPIFSATVIKTPFSLSTKLAALFLI
jgi:hypothetical protein